MSGEVYDHRVGQLCVAAAQLREPVLHGPEDDI